MKQRGRDAFMGWAISMALTWRSEIGRSPETRAQASYLISQQGNQDSWAGVNYQESWELMARRKSRIYSGKQTHTFRHQWSHKTKHTQPKWRLHHASLYKIINTLFHTETSMFALSYKLVAYVHQHTTAHKTHSFISSAEHHPTVI